MNTFKKVWNILSLNIIGFSVTFLLSLWFVIYTLRFQDKLLIFLQRQIQSIEILGIISLLILILVLLFPFIQKIWIRYQNNYQLENPPAVFIDYIFFFLISFCGNSFNKYL